jgi:hypothetical protein
MGKADRRWIDPLDVIPRLGTYIRVVTLSDGYTVHNVFKDSDFSA